MMNLEVSGWRAVLIIFAILWCLFGGMRMLAELIVWLSQAR